MCLIKMLNTKGRIVLVTKDKVKERLSEGFILLSNRKLSKSQSQNRVIADLMIAGANVDDIR